MEVELSSKRAATKEWNCCTLTLHIQYNFVKATSLQKLCRLFDKAGAQLQSSNHPCQPVKQSDICWSWEEAGARGDKMLYNRAASLAKRGKSELLSLQNFLRNHTPLELISYPNCNFKNGGVCLTCIFMACTLSARAFQDLHTMHLCHIWDLEIRTEVCLLSVLGLSWISAQNLQPGLMISIKDQWVFQNMWCTAEVRIARVSNHVDSTKSSGCPREYGWIPNKDTMLTWAILTVFQFLSNLAAIQKFNVSLALNSWSAGPLARERGLFAETGQADICGDVGQLLTSAQGWLLGKTFQFLFGPLQISSEVVCECLSMQVELSSKRAATKEWNCCTLTLHIQYNFCQSNKSWQKLCRLFDKAGAQLQSSNHPVSLLNSLTSAGAERSWCKRRQDVYTIVLLPLQKEESPSFYHCKTSFETIHPSH